MALMWTLTPPKYAFPSNMPAIQNTGLVLIIQGGTHVNYIVDQVVSKLLESAKKKNKGGMDLKPFHIKGHLWVFVNCQIENPSFDSQTKENMTLKVKSFGSTCSLSDKFIKQVCPTAAYDMHTSQSATYTHEILD